ncbi:MAG: exodeoxyribonuclease VII large subunit [Elusimicrobia bacterium]|nr:exodeoxyribonuclease VII large subunit [Elusimicrobiota bacterium]
MSPSPRPGRPEGAAGPELDFGEPSRKVYSVAELVTRIHDLLEGAYQEVWVEGEISGARAYPSGHTYFTLKDAQSQLSAVLFKGYASSMKFEPKDGIKCLVRARVSAYVARGSLQLIVLHMEPKEKGALQLAFEQLKAKLAAEGLFDPGRKKPLPAFPRRVGLVTSQQGAAVRDMLTVLKRRWEGLEITLFPVKVQGEGAALEISAAIAAFNEHFPETDVLLVGRGGGSIEDLWAFNEEPVARAIADSKIPVVSCVGHETDFTIADFVADVRAPTPSAAAELAAPDKPALLARIRETSRSLAAVMTGRLARVEARLKAAAGHPFLQAPHRLYEERIRRVDDVAVRLPEAMGRLLSHKEKDLKLLLEKLQALSPLNVLSRGYAIAWKLPGEELLRRSSQTKKGDKLRVRLHEGEIHCEVLE